MPRPRRISGRLMAAPEWLEQALEHTQPKARRARYPSPGALAKSLWPKTVQTPALDAIDEFLLRAAATPDFRGIITMPPQEGKSTRVALDFPIWWLLSHPDDKVVVASYSAGLATRNGKAIRRGIQHNPDLGIRLEPGSEAAGDWTLLGYRGGVFSIGIGGGLTGRAADILIIDDPIKDRKEADSEVFRENVWEWWREVGLSRLAPGAPVVLILTRWHEDDLAGRLLDEDDSEWVVLNIPAQADHDPAKGQTDVLGREPGEYMVSARGRTPAQWAARQKAVGSRAWNAQYQGAPSPAAGGILHGDWWQLYARPMWLERTDGSCVVAVEGTGDAEIIQSWDFTFKDTKGSDWVVGQVWLRIGVHAYLLDQVRGRWTFSESCKQMVTLSAKWPQAVAKLVEDKANGPAILNALRAYLPGMIPIEPEGSKYARASAVAPLVESKNVHLYAAAPYVQGFIEECKSFPNAKHDDQVDAFSQAIHRLLLVPMLNGGLITSDDIAAGLLDDFEYQLASALAPY
jgi:predicted phage terminase large subunit-like protein